ncbi:MAG: imidazoleglycerol-phosphate dehydratase HisB [Desulfohalobiaceae bacterium]
MQQRRAEYSRQTKETEIRVKIDLDGKSRIQVQTGLGWADHMLTLLGFWAGFDLEIQAQGDLEVDGHHTLEDTGLCLGEALQRAIGDKSGLARVGWAKVPMDESLSEAIVDISGRPYLVYQDHILPLLIFGQEKDLWREFFKSLAFKAGLNLHIIFHYGQNGHHLLESACKALGLALKQGSTLQQEGVRSSKGSLD